LWMFLLEPPALTCDILYLLLLSLVVLMGLINPFNCTKKIALRQGVGRAYRVFSDCSNAGFDKGLCALSRSGCRYREKPGTRVQPRQGYSLEVELKIN